MKPALVLLPALGCDGELYRPQIQGLGELVEPLPLVVAEPDMSRAVESVLSEAPARFLLAGTSYGGSLALAVAATAPERIAGLCLMGCNPGPHPDPAGARTRASRLRAGELEAVIDELTHELAEPAGPRGAAAAEAFREMARRVGAEAMARQSDSMAGRRDLRPDLGRLAAPALLLWGDRDRFADAAHGRFMAERMPRAVLHILPRCGHLPTLEYPDQATAQARAWIGRATAA